MRLRCICGCDEPVVALHHVVYQQELRRVAAGLTWEEKAGRGLLADPRNLVHVAFRCHGNHHAASQRYLLHMLPDSVFEFAVEVLGEGRAFNYLRRRYDGQDPRLDALLEVVVA